MQNDSLFYFCLGEAVRHVRLEHEMTQQDLAEQGIYVSQLSRIENGRPTTLRTIIRISYALGIKASELLHRAEDLFAEIQGGKISGDGQ